MGNNTAQSGSNENYIELVEEKDVLFHATTKYELSIGTTVALGYTEEDARKEFQDELEQKIYNRSIKIKTAEDDCGQLRKRSNNNGKRAKFIYRCQYENHNDIKCLEYRTERKFYSPLQQYFAENKFSSIDYSNLTIQIHSNSAIEYGVECNDAPFRIEYDNQHTTVNSIEYKLRKSKQSKLLFWGSTQIFSIGNTYPSAKDLYNALKEDAKKKYPFLSKKKLNIVIQNMKNDIAKKNEDLLVKLAYDFVLWDVTNSQLSYMREKGYHRLRSINIKKKWKPLSKIACAVKGDEKFALRLNEKKCSDEESIEIDKEGYKLRFYDKKDLGVMYAVDDPNEPCRIVNIKEYVKLVEWDSGNPFLSSWFGYFGYGEGSKRQLLSLKKYFLRKV